MIRIRMTRISYTSAKIGIKVALIVFVLMLIAQCVFGVGAALGRMLRDESSVAVDNSGNIYVFGNGNSPYAIQKLDPQGNFVAKWGPYGVGDGQFKGTGSPNSIAVDSNNNVYVLDSNQYRVQKFDSKGHFLTKWGSKGNGDGQFADYSNGPCSLTVDNQANVYVFDCGNYRVQKFDSQGHFLTKWGSKGNGDGQFNYSDGGLYGGGITVDKQGNVYVVDSGNKLIEKFDGQGHFLLKWGGSGNAPGEFGSAEWNGPVGLAIDDQLNVYVSDGSYIRKYDSQGHFLVRWDDNKGAWWPSNDRDYQDSEGIAVDKQGTVYTVANVYNDDHDKIGNTGYYNAHLQTFDSNGHFLKRWGDRFYLPWWFVFTASAAIGFLVSYLRSKRRNRIFAQYVGTTKINGVDHDDTATVLAGVRKDINDYVGRYEMDSFPDGSVKVWFITTLVLLLIMLIAQVGFAVINWSARLTLTSRSVALDNSGNIYAYANSPYIIQELDPQGNFVAKWGTHGTGNSQFSGKNTPNSIAVDNNYNVYVSDSGNYRIQKFDSQGRFIDKWGTQGNGDGQFGTTFGGPCGLSSDNLNDVYVFDCGNYRIEKFDSQGHFLTKWGSQGNGDGQFSSADGGITADKQGNVYVADSGNKRIEKFDSQGKFLLKWGGIGKEPGQFGTSSEVGPFGLATDNQLNVYVSDGSQIQLFDGNGHFLTRWNITDAAVWPADNKLYAYSKSIAVDKQNKIYTVSGIIDDNHPKIGETEYYNMHIQIFDTQGELLKRFDDPFYLPWGFVFVAPATIGLVVSYLYAKRRIE